MRAFASCGTSITRDRYGVDDPKLPALPLRRAGQLARPHRGAAREQRVAHPDRGARRDAVARRALPRAAAADLERGAVAAAPVGPAVVAAPAADPRLRDRPARVSRPVRRLAGRRAEGRRADRRGATPRSTRSTRWAARSRAIESGYMKAALVRSLAERLARINSGEQVVVGATSGPTACRRRCVGGDDGGVFKVDADAGGETLARSRATKRRARRRAAVDGAGARSRDARADRREPDAGSRSSARSARVTTGEWAGALRARVRRVPRRPPASTASACSSSGGGRRRCARASRTSRRRARPAAAHGGRQARPRRPLERRRGDRGRRAPRRLRRRLRRHPPDRRRDRRRRRSRRTRASSASRSCRARTSSSRARCSPSCARSRAPASIPVVRRRHRAADDDVPTLRALGVARVFTPRTTTSSTSWTASST